MSSKISFAPNAILALDLTLMAAGKGIKMYGLVWILSFLLDLIS